MKVPHILKDGADSVGVAGATIRVYMNIGMYSQHWLQQHQALLGLMPQKPFSIDDGAGEFRLLARDAGEGRQRRRSFSQS